MNHTHHTPDQTKEKEAVVQHLGRLLASTYTLYLKTQNYHWNVTGPWFQSLHALFETEYTELALAVDEIAEHIKTMGAHAPGSYTLYRQLSVIKDADDTNRPDAKAMLQQLVADHHAIVALIQEGTATIADQASYQTTMDLLVRRSQVHEKSLWMLNSSLEQ